MAWNDIRDDCLIAHRKKTGRILRIATLWPQTLEALAKVQRKAGDAIFYAESGSPLTVSGAGKRFRRLRKEAKVADSVQASHIRDGAATAAAGANVTEALIALLLGHRSGIADHYCKRNPKMVAPACQAVFDAYLSTAAPVAT